MGGGGRLTGVGSLLDGVAVGALGQEEGVIGETEEERRLLLDLPHAVLDRRGIGVGHRVEVQRDDRDTVGELLCKKSKSASEKSGGERETKNTHQHTSSPNTTSRNGKGSTEH
jgi:hypothetical protein